MLGTDAMLSLCQYLRKVILSSLIIKRRNSLLDVVGKVLEKLFMKLVAEDVLPDSQCSFRAGRRCTDMIFN